MEKSINVTVQKRVKNTLKTICDLINEQIQSKHNKNMITACHTNIVIFFCPPGTSDFLKKSPEKGLWVKQGGPAFFPHWM